MKPETWLAFFMGVMGTTVICVLVMPQLWNGAPWNRSDVAAWVQAIGSILAIIAAFLVAARQERTAEAVRQRDRNDAALQALTLCEGAMRRVHGILTTMRVFSSIDLAR